MKKSTTASMVAASALAAFAILPSQAASAGTWTCTIAPTYTNCNVGYIAASQNVIWTEVRNCYYTAIGSSVTWKLIDVGNGVAVARGTVPWGKQFQKTTTGLYSDYVLKIYGNPGSRGKIANTNPNWGGGWSDC
ncbi:hypothetical protein [Nonomuraea sp. NPDC050540]|uniref:hypothetical protein n=1 Tax=Nonomuraea sp. NPDC050540 TaxID=3364367 RepID=UPI00379E9174